MPKLPTQTCKPNQLPWRMNVPEDKECNCVYTVPHCLTTVDITLSTATSYRFVDHINAVHLPTAYTRGGSENRSSLAKYGNRMDMCHILNEPPASVKRRKHSKLCILTAVYDVQINTNFPRKIGLTSWTTQKAPSKVRKLVTSRNMEDHRNAVGTTLLLRVSKKKACSYNPQYRTIIFLFVPTVYCKLLGTIVHVLPPLRKHLLPQRTDEPWYFWDKPSPAASTFVIPEQSNLLCSLKEQRTRRATPSVTTWLNK